MHTVETKVGKQKHTVTFYDSDRVLTYRRYHKFNKHLAIAVEVGNSLEDYDKRTARTIMYLNADDKKSAVTELTNQRQCLCCYGSFNRWRSIYRLRGNGTR